MATRGIVQARQHMNKRFRILNRFNRNHPEAHTHWRLSKVQFMLREQANFAAIQLIALVTSRINLYHDWTRVQMPATKRIKHIRELRAELRSALELVLPTK